ncbi:sensor histidine kinase [Streptomyces monticola]|uniref:Sensor histidine kinase n=1 Tax=Streptomyces monticola TaxID=2666263 RepID=A0ABW2JWL7_9ACTN
MFVQVRKWRERSDLARVDLYTRWTVYLLVWVTVPVVVALSVTRPVRHSAPPLLIAAVVALILVQAVWAVRLLRAGFDAYLGRQEVPRRDIGAGAALMGAVLAGLLVLGSLTGPTDFPLLPTALGCATLPFFSFYGLMVPVRTSVPALLAVTVALCAALWLVSRELPLTLATAISVVFAGGWMALTVRISAWTLGVMYELREARDVQARLAVAEERLRFGRDLHDVLGRNLAVVALKSELAVQLARRGRPEAVEQMTEVQRIAQESQREVREVVRGYREIGLGAELAGAQGVLKAAGIDCRVLGAEAADELPPAVHAALGWVVREAATNVLRHGDAARCTVALRVTSQDPATAVLTVENDGAPEPPAQGSSAPDPAAEGLSGEGLSGEGLSGEGLSAPGSSAEGSSADGSSGGSGLMGLRERLSQVDGVLEAGPTSGGHFRLTAEVPLPTAVGPAERITG